MFDYPVNLQLRDRLCLVVGAGPVGLRKVRGLLAAGARVRLVAERTGEVPSGTVELRVGAYRRTDLDDALLAFAATDDPALNRTVVADARAAGVLASSVDDPKHSDFTLPALLRRGHLAVAVGTGGLSPALAATVRDRLAGGLGPEWGTVVEIAAALRRRRLTGSGDHEYNHEVLRRLLEAGLPERLAAGDTAGVDRLLAAVAGGGASLETLGIRLPKGRP